MQRRADHLLHCLRLELPLPSSDYKPRLQNCLGCFQFHHARQNHDLCFDNRVRVAEAVQVLNRAERSGDTVCGKEDELIAGLEVEVARAHQLECAAQRRLTSHGQHPKISGGETSDFKVKYTTVRLSVIALNRQCSERITWADYPRVSNVAANGTNTRQGSAIFDGYAGVARVAFDPGSGSRDYICRHRSG